MDNKTLFTNFFEDKLSDLSTGIDFVTEEDRSALSAIKLTANESIIFTPFGHYAVEVANNSLSTLMNTSANTYSEADAIVRYDAAGSVDVSDFNAIYGSFTDSGFYRLKAKAYGTGKKYVVVENINKISASFSSSWVQMFPADLKRVYVGATNPDNETYFTTSADFRAVYPTNDGLRVVGVVEGTYSAYQNWRNPIIDEVLLSGNTSHTIGSYNANHKCDFIGVVNDGETKPYVGSGSLYFQGYDLHMKNILRVGHIYFGIYGTTRTETHLDQQNILFENVDLSGSANVYGGPFTTSTKPSCSMGEINLTFMNVTGNKTLYAGGYNQVNSGIIHIGTLNTIISGDNSAFGTVMNGATDNSDATTQTSLSTYIENSNLTIYGGTFSARCWNWWICKTPRKDKHNWPQQCDSLWRTI